MSRTKETWDTIDETKTSLIGNVEKPALYLLPILSQIALSLAVIADKMTEGAEKACTESITFFSEKTIFLLVRIPVR